jgi:hypothetical protein
VKEAYPNAQRISVDLQTIRFTDPERGVRYTYLTPRTAQVLLVKFDQGHDIEPLTVQLRSGSATRSGARTPEQREGDRARKQRSNARVAARRRLAQSQGPGHAPIADGGSATPPRGALANPAIPGGNRRRFGLRAFEL